MSCLHSVSFLSLSTWYTLFPYCFISADQAQGAERPRASSQGPAHPTTATAPATATTVPASVAALGGVTSFDKIIQEAVGSPEFSAAARAGGLTSGDVQSWIKQK